MSKITFISTKQRALLTLLFVCLMSLSSALAQTVQLTGTVTDTKGAELIGASVLEKGTTNGCITDINGNTQFSYYYQDLYRDINFANQVLEYAPQIPEGNISEAKHSEIIAE